MTNYPAARAAVMDAIRPGTLPLAVRFLQEGEGFPKRRDAPGPCWKNGSRSARE